MMTGKWKLENSYDITKSVKHTEFTQMQLGHQETLPFQSYGLAQPSRMWKGLVYLKHVRDIL